MNRRIDKEWSKLGFKNQNRVPMAKCSPKLLYLMFRRNDRVQIRDEKLNK